VIKIAKAVSTSYTTPSRQEVGDGLLKLNYDARQRSIVAKLRIDKEIFGLTLLGDGATVHKMPFINMLGSGVHLPAGVLEIVDCTSHLETGGKKDAVYITSKFTKHLEMLDENKDSVDVIYFDGASNVQKAGHPGNMCSVSLG
jgi:hypothetical protein